LSFSEHIFESQTDRRPSPRSGRSTIAQRFIAGICIEKPRQVRVADDRSSADYSQQNLPSAARTPTKISRRRPSTKSAGLFSFVRCADYIFAPRPTVCLIAIVFVALTLACSHDLPNSGSVATHEVTDEAGRRVTLPTKIDRIVSLAPNLTEIVYAVGAGDRLVGRTSYCDYPPQARTVTEIGDTLHPSVERIIALRPQVVLVSTASQLENFTQQLDEQKIAVYVTNPQSLDQVFHSIETLGQLFGTTELAKRLADDLRYRALMIENPTIPLKPIRVFYQVSDEPLYTIGREAYLTDLIKRAGGISVTADVPTAFPRFSDEAALASKPEAIILPTGGSMGNSNSNVAPALKNSPAVRDNRVYKINDDLLSRPGPRLVDGLEQLARALHPEAFK
jgi:cobalamin transport system substrate-binding protein